MFVAFGIAYSYGAFLEEMRADFGIGRAAGATFFSLTALLYFGLGSIAGAAGDRYGQRRVLLVGAVAMGVGLVVTSRADSLGDRARGLRARGRHRRRVRLRADGGARRRVVRAPAHARAGRRGGRHRHRHADDPARDGGADRGDRLARQLPGPGGDRSGRARAVRARGGARARRRSGRSPPRCATRCAIRGYRRLYLATALLGVPLFVPFVYLPSYAEERGVDPVLAAGLIGAIGTASVAGRIALGAIAGPFGLARVFLGCFLAMGLSFALWLVAGGSYAMLLLFAVVLGVGYGGYVALAPAVVAERFGVERLGALLGVLYTSAGIGTAVGAPAAGAIIDAGGYTPAIVASLAIGLASFAVAAAR